MLDDGSNGVIDDVYRCLLMVIYMHEFNVKMAFIYIYIYIYMVNAKHTLDGFTACGTFKSEINSIPKLDL